jgi:hypothetical protein
MDLVRLKTNAVLVICVLFTLVGLVWALTSNDLMASVVLLFFGGCGAIVLVMRQDEMAGEPRNALERLEAAIVGGPAQRLMVLVVGCLAWVGAGLLMVLHGEDANLGWTAVAFGAACALVFAAQRVDESHRRETAAHGALVVDPDRARRWARTRTVVMALASLSFAAMFGLMLRQNVAPWVAWPGLMFFGLGALAMLVAAALGRPPARVS